MPRLTKTLVDKLQPRTRRYDVFCDSLRGFSVRVNADGSKTAAFRYTRDGKRHRVTLGVLGQGFTLDRARRRAESLRGEVLAGGHPARDRDQRRQAPTFASVAERYMTELARPYRKASTVRGYESLLRVHLLPARAFPALRDALTHYPAASRSRCSRRQPGAPHPATQET